MPGTWPTARAAIASTLDGLTVDLGAAYKTETLKALEFAPGGRQPVSVWPYAFILPVEVEVNRFPGKMREWIVPALIVRVMLAPSGEAAIDVNVLHQRYDAWILALVDAWDAVAALGGSADISVQQRFGGLAEYADLDRGWGFDMTLPGVRLTEEKTFTS